MMKMLLDIKIDEPEIKLDYRDGIMMVGSMFHRTYRRCIT